MKPVTEVIKDGYNGILVDFYDVDKIVEAVNYALDNQDKMINIRNNARRTIVENYNLKDLSIFKNGWQYASIQR